MQPIKHNTQKAQEELAAAKSIEEYRQKYEQLQASGALDPDSPNFNIELFNSDAVFPAEFMQVINSISEQMLEYMQTPEYKRIAAIEKEIYKFIKNNGYTTDSNGKSCIKDNFKKIFKNADRLAVLIEKMPKFTEGASVEDILKGGFDNDGKPINDAFLQLFDNRPIAKGNTIIKPIDKLSRVLFDPIFQRKNDPYFIPGQMSFEDAHLIFEETIPRNIRTSPQKSKEDICIYLSGGFDDNKFPAHLSRELTAEQEEIHDAVATMIKEGRRSTTATEIYQRINGKNKNPSTNDIKKIDDSMQALRACHITINNKEEIQAGYKYKSYIEVEDTLIHYRNARKKSIFNDKSEECYYEFIGNDLPILLAFASRGENPQITTITTEQWAVPVRKSELTNQLKRYLFRRIAKIKRDKEKNKRVNNKIAIESIYEACHAEKDRRKRYKIKDYIPDFLLHWKKTKFIKDYIIREEENIIYINPSEEQRRRFL